MGSNNRNSLGKIQDLWFVFCRFQQTIGSNGITPVLFRADVLVSERLLVDPNWPLRKARELSGIQSSIPRCLSLMVPEDPRYIQNSSADGSNISWTRPLGLVVGALNIY